MRVYSFFRSGLAVAAVAFFLFGFIDQSQSQTCYSVSTGEDAIDIHNNYPCTVTVCITYTGGGGGTLCCAVPGASGSMNYGIPSGGSITGVTVDGYTISTSIACYPNPCSTMGNCTNLNEVEAYHDTGGPQGLLNIHVN